ncbi:putative Cell shape determination protein CcmA [Candidatus Xenohaliotis californiensis]|uniref:Cell shape determination protein CcmA n=1 Tax=Candidatus Xenohaliotis californiensis TaxID=84677 RepID=A0ABP0EWH9_9RICK|nr:putative Cell shape determination protein CcmA [Candidatus Xenohaliotis californiensis]
MIFKNSKKTHKSTIPSIISEDAKIQGTVISSGSIEVAGQIDGNAKCRAINIHKSGVVIGDIIAEDVIISGKTRGNIKTKNIFLTETGIVVGTICYKNIIITSGALIDGKLCKVEQNQAIKITTNKDMKNNLTNELKNDKEKI